MAIGYPRTTSFSFTPLLSLLLLLLVAQVHSQWIIPVKKCSQCTHWQECLAVSCHCVWCTNTSLCLATDTHSHNSSKLCPANGTIPYCPSDAMRFLRAFFWTLLVLAGLVIFVVFALFLYLLGSNLSCGRETLSSTQEKSSLLAATRSNGNYGVASPVEMSVNMNGGGVV
jgi:hypothetical protein